MDGRAVQGEEISRLNSVFPHIPSMAVSFLQGSICVLFCFGFDGKDKGSLRAFHGAWKVGSF